MKSGDMTLYRGCTPVVDAHYSKDDSETPAEAIVGAVAEAADIETVELPPLYEFIEPDALNTLFQQHEGAVDSGAILSFSIGH